MSVRNVQRAREAVARIAIVLTVVIAIVGAVILTQRMSAESELFSLADRGDAQALKAAVTSGNVNAVDRWGSTALIRAAILGHDEACRVLLAAGADARRKDRKGFSALDYVN